MKIVTITYGYGRTLRPADFESVRADLTVQCQLEEGDDVKKCTEQLISKVKTRVLESLKTEKSEPKE